MEKKYNNLNCIIYNKGFMLILNWEVPHLYHLKDQLRKDYAEAYTGFFRDYLTDNGVPARFTVHLVDVPDEAASYEFYSTALYQQSLQ